LAEPRKGHSAKRKGGHSHEARRGNFAELRRGNSHELSGGHSTKYMGDHFLNYRGTSPPMSGSDTTANEVEIAPLMTGDGIPHMTGEAILPIRTLYHKQY